VHSDALGKGNMRTNALTNVRFSINWRFVGQPRNCQIFKDPYHENRINFMEQVPF
jgi:hypothetical protein